MNNPTLFFSSMPDDFQSQSKRIYNHEPSFERMAHGVRIIICPFWLDDYSYPEHSLYSWAYHVRIENHGQNHLCILSQDWSIIQDNGKIKSIDNKNIFTNTQQLAPGKACEYSSSLSLNTPSNFIRGVYHTSYADGHSFDLSIPTFSLDSPYQNFILH